MIPGVIPVKKQQDIKSLAKDLIIETQKKKEEEFHSLTTLEGIRKVRRLIKTDLILIPSMRLLDWGLMGNSQFRAMRNRISNYL